MKRLVWGLGFRSGEDSRLRAGTLPLDFRRPPPRRHKTKNFLPPLLIADGTSLARIYRR